jgi:phosphopantetheinyl transferase (holo-ACP synthase)
VMLWQVPMLPDELCTQSGGICLRIIAQVILTPAERADWKALSGSLRHRREWLFGRAALKESVRHWIHRQTGELLYLTDIEVGHDELGAPCVDGDWRGRLIDAPQVSLSHSGQDCVAAVAAHARRVLEVDAHRDRVVRMWCAKEAAAKCLGTGLQGQPDAFVVVSVDTAFERLRVESAWGAVDTWIRDHGGTILAVATPEAHEATDLEVMDE